MPLRPPAYRQNGTLFLFPSWWVAKNNEALRQFEQQALAGCSAPEIIASRIDAILAFDRTAELHRIRTPTLIVGCEDDLDAGLASAFALPLARAALGALSSAPTMRGGSSLNVRSNGDGSLALSTMR